MTKGLRTLRTAEAEAKVLAEEYQELAKALEPEYEILKVDTANARSHHLVSHNAAKNVYAEHLFKQSVEQLFSMPEAAPFLMSLKHKFAVREMEMRKHPAVPYSETSIEEAKGEILLEILKPLIAGCKSAGDENDLLKTIQAIHYLPEEYNEREHSNNHYSDQISPAMLRRKREEAEARMH